MLVILRTEPRRTCVLAELAVRRLGENEEILPGLACNAYI